MTCIAILFQASTQIVPGNLGFNPIVQFIRQFFGYSKIIWRDLSKFAPTVGD